MRFFSLTSVLLASIASVTALPQSGGGSGSGSTTVAGSIDATVNGLQAALTGYEAAITSAVATVKSSTTVAVAVQAEAIINSNLAAIASALGNASASLVSTTGLTTGAVLSTATGLTQSEIDMLVADIGTVGDILSGLNATVSLVGSLDVAAQLVVGGELSAVRNAIAPFVTPIAVFAEAVVYVGGSVDVSGLSNAIAGLQKIVSSFKASLGLGQVDTLISSLMSNPAVALAGFIGAAGI